MKSKYFLISNIFNYILKIMSLIKISMDAIHRAGASKDHDY